MKKKHAARNWWQRAGARARWIVIGVVALLVAVRLCLPAVIESYVNRQLNRSSAYGGRIGHVGIQLWRGEYSIHGLEILKRTGGVTTPFFSASNLDLSVEWKELLHGAVAGQIIMHDPRLNFEVGPTPEQTQTGKEEQWNDVLASLFPIKLNRVEIKNGEIHFRNPNRKPPVDIYLSKISATATNLSNTRDLKNELPAGVRAESTTLGGGGLNFQLQFNPLSEDPTYQLDTALTNVDATALNDFLKAYGKFDIQHGVFSLFTSVAAKDGNYEGYFKVFFHDLKVFSWEKDKDKNVLEIFWQAVVGTVATVLKNQPKDTLAARVPISGSYKGSKVGIWSGVGTLLQNAFIQSLSPKIDEKMTVEKVEKQEKGTNDERQLPEEQAAPTTKGAEKLAPNTNSP